MLLGYQYKLKPNKQQSKRISNWVDMLRANYNYNLRDRIDTYQERFKCGEYCDIQTKAVICPVACSISGKATSENGQYFKKSGKARSAKEIQDANLSVMKKIRPWYQDVDSTALQANVANLDKAFDGFFQGKGYPKFKNRSNFKSFTVKSGIRVEGNRIKLGTLGFVRFHDSRPIPDGFVIKSATVRIKADGFYVSEKIEDKTIRDYKEPDLTSVKTAVGVDLGITKLAHCSDGQQFDNPKFLTNKKTRHLLKVRQRDIARKKKGSNNKKKAGKAVAKLHQKIADRRNAYQWKVAKKITGKADLIVVEDLNVSAMKKRCKPQPDPANTGQYLKNGQSRKQGLNRSFSNTSWFSLTLKIKYLAEKQGKVFRKVNPRFTSQTCPECGHVHKSNRNKEKFICTNCGYFAHADINAARNIRKRGLDLIPAIKEEPEIWNFKRENCTGGLSGTLLA